ncbi:MAG: hypothetical protein KAR06_04875 [Deltaproteobacteria bacterium]|nr:hypothetical protein [Deltaproteobacteria bacterium]
MTKSELTLEILDQAIRKVDAFNKANEIIGFKLHPSDLRNIEEATASLVCLDNNTLTVTPPYKGMNLVADNTIPPGYPQPIRRCHD